MKRLALLGLIGVALGAAQVPPAPGIPSVTLSSDLQQVLTDYESAWSRKDAIALANLFAEDGFVLPNGGMPVRGRANIAKFYANSGGPLALRAIHFETSGNVGFILGGFASKPGDVDGGKFTLTLRRKEGKWLIVSDMDSPNQRRQP